MALHDDVCWLELNRYSRDADLPEPTRGEECALRRERSVAGKSNVIPSCAVHGKAGDSVTGPVVRSGS